MAKTTTTPKTTEPVPELQETPGDIESGSTLYPLTRPNDTPIQSWNDTVHRLPNLTTLRNIGIHTASQEVTMASYSGFIVKASESTEATGKPPEESVMLATSTGVTAEVLGVTTEVFGVTEAENTVVTPTTTTTTTPRPTTTTTTTTPRPTTTTTTTPRPTTTTTTTTHAPAHKTTTTTTHPPAHKTTTTTTTHKPATTTTHAPAHKTTTTTTHKPKTHKSEDTSEPSAILDSIGEISEAAGHISEAAKEISESTEHLTEVMEESWGPEKVTNP